MASTNVKLGGGGSTSSHSIAKAWVKYDGSSQTVLASYGVSSVTYVGVGTYQINFSTPFSGADYVAVAMGTVRGSDTRWTFQDDVATTASAFTLVATNGAGARNDGLIHIVFFGD